MFETNNKINVVSKNITINGRRTSIRLDIIMWKALYEITQRENCTVHDIAGIISKRKPPTVTLTTAIRAFTLSYYKAAATEQGHKRANHGNLIALARL